MLAEPQITFEESGIDFYTAQNFCEELCNAHEVASRGYEYGISFSEWYGDNEKLAKEICEKWWVNLPLHEKQKLITDEVFRLNKCIERDIKKKDNLSNFLAKIADYHIAKNCLGSDRTHYGDSEQFDGLFNQ